MFQIKLNDEDHIEYVPNYSNNRDLAESWDGSGERNFFWVKMRPLSGRDLNKLSGHMIKSGKSQNIMRDAERVVARVFSEYVVEVGGVSFQGADGTVTPRTGAELYDTIQSGYPSLGEIIDDIYAALRDGSKADEGDLKKLR